MFSVSVDAVKCENTLVQSGYKHYSSVEFCDSLDVMKGHRRYGQQGESTLV